MTRCFSTSSLLSRRAAGLGESERLELEEHLADCASCREDAAALEGVRELLGDGFELDASTRNRLLDRAFTQAAEGVPVRTPRRWRTSLLVAASFLLASSVWGITRIPRVENRMTLASAPRLDPRLWEPRVLEGRVRADGRQLETGDVLGSRVRIESSGSAKVRLGPSFVAMSPGTSFTWDAASSSVRLESGSVALDVAHRQDRAFSVITEELRVDVVGTKFSVSRKEVAVSAGRVKVTLFADQSVHELGGGEKWTLEPRETSNPSTPAPASEPDVAALLASARRALAQGRVDGARRDVQRALAGKPSPAERAEAQTLLAECALVSGDSSSAQEGYSKVARENAGTAAGETAAYAAARLEKNPAKARALLEAYLSRYPKGRYRSEVSARLRALPR